MIVTSWGNTQSFGPKLFIFLKFKSFQLHLSASLNLGDMFLELRRFGMSLERSVIFPCLAEHENVRVGRALVIWFLHLICATIYSYQNNSLSYYSNLSYSFISYYFARKLNRIRRRSLGCSVACSSFSGSL